MKIVLVNTVMQNSGFANMFKTPPYWAAILARKISDHGGEAELLDLQFQDTKNLDIKKKYYKNADAVFISGMTPCYPQMIKISKFYIDKGIKVIFGGWAVTSLYYSRDIVNLEEHLFPFCDAAVIGEAETAIDELLDDLKNGKLKSDKIYASDPEKWDWVMPDFTVWTKEYSFGAIQTQRGCPHNCKFCSVANVLGTRVRAKPVENVRKEVELLQKTHGYDLICFYDDNIIGKDDGNYAKKLFIMFKSNFPKISWFSQCTARIIDKPELLDLFEESRCVLLLFGFESLLNESLKEVTRKNFDMTTNEEREKKYRELIEMLKKRGIETWGCFIYGFEHDTEKIFEKNLKFALESGIFIYQATILTPLPGTPLFKESVNKLLYPLTPENWGKYDFSRPTLIAHSKYMDNKTLEKGYLDSYEDFYKKTNTLLMLLKSRIPKSFIMRITKEIARYFLIRTYMHLTQRLYKNKKIRYFTSSLIYFY